MLALCGLVASALYEALLRKEKNRVLVELNLAYHDKMRNYEELLSGSISCVQVENIIGLKKS